MLIGGAIGSALAPHDPVISLGVTVGSSSVLGLSKAASKAKGWINGSTCVGVRSVQGLLKVTFHEAYQFPDRTVYERYDNIPVGNGSAIYRTIMGIYDMPWPVEGEIWQISARIHATNDDARADGKGIFLTTGVHLGEDFGHDPSGYQPLVVRSGSFNLGVEAHHGMIEVVRDWHWTAARITALGAAFPTHPVLHLKFIINAGTGDPEDYEVEITPNRGFCEVTRLVPQ